MSTHRRVEANHEVDDNAIEETLYKSDGQLAEGHGDTLGVGGVELVVSVLEEHPGGSGGAGRERYGISAGCSLLVCGRAR